MASGDLKSFVEEVTGASHLRVEDDLGDGYVRLNSAEAERRQAKHDIRGTEDIVIEMLRNSRDAGAAHIFCAVSREGSVRRLTIVDDGCGIPANLVERIFEARVTSKLDSMHVDTWGVHGRGMALFAIKENAKDAFVAATVRDGGSAIVVQTDTEELSEKTDQSSMPVFSLSESGTVVVRGPRNINRTVAEFAYVDRATCEVYLGSPVEIAATLWNYGRSAGASSDAGLDADVDEVPVLLRLARTKTPESFARTASELGIVISDRSARRIMDGEIAPLSSVAEGIDPYATPAAGKQEVAKHASRESQHKQRVPFDRRGLQIDSEDMEHFKKAISRAYASLAKSYYLEEGIEPTVKVKRDSIRITIPVRKQL